MAENIEKNVGGEAGAAGKFGFKVKLNRQDREFRVCLTRATAGVGLAAVCGILVGVVATARHVSNQGPEAARADIREIPLIPSGKAAAKPSSSARGTATTAKPAPAAKPPVAPVALAPTKPALVTTSTPAPGAVAQPKAAKTAVAAAPSAPRDGRTVGHQYLVLGSYPNQADANAAVEKLGRAGVRCTAEKSLPGWTRKGWYSVVTVNGYASQDRAFVKQVKALEAKGFEAHAYKWR